MTRTGRPGRRGAGVALALSAVLLLGCGQEQEPDVIPTDDDAPATTSRLLEPCPPGGPDDTTPAAGCLDPDGVVQRP